MLEIQQAELLAALFGHWPDFHDAEIRAIRLDASNHAGPALEVDFEVAEMSGQVDDRGYVRDRQRALTTIRFDEVARLRLSDFLYQNVVLEMEIRLATAAEHDEMFGDDTVGQRRFRVGWTSSIGCQAEFLCDAIRVVAASPIRRAIEPTSGGSGHQKSVS